VAEALRRGAHAVVVGTAITNPRDITRRFVAGTVAR
jgi:putative N-acetylmannosamine-6-phosphate epimerase